MELSQLAVFVLAAETGSLSEAGRRIGLSPTLAGRRLAALETELGVRLMHRTTRSVRPTPDGEAFLPHAQTIVEAEAQARASLSPARAAVGGLLRVTAPAEFGRQFAAPLVAELLAAHPRLKVDLILTDSVVDIVSAGIDVAVRIARLKDSSLIARRLAGNRIALCASPAYLARAGTPRTVADLAAHECLVLNGANVWVFGEGAGERRARVSGRLSANSLEAVREACAAGLGLALLSAWKVAPELARGALVEVALEDAPPPQELGVWAVYPSARLVPPKLRAFIAALEARLRADPRLR